MFNLNFTADQLAGVIVALANSGTGNSISALEAIAGQIPESVSTIVELVGVDILLATQEQDYKHDGFECGAL